MADTGPKVDSIQIEVKADTKSAQSNISKLTERLIELQKVADKTIQYNALTRVDALAKSLERLSHVRAFPKEFASRLTDVGKAASSLAGMDFSKFDEFASALAKLGSVGTIKTPNIKNAVDESKKSTAALTGTIKENSHAVEDNGRKSESAAKRISQKAIYQNHLKQATQDSTNATKSNTSAIRSSSSAYSKFNSVIKSAVGSLTKFSVNIATLPFRKLGAAITSPIKKLGNFFSSLKRIAMYRAIRTALKEITQGFKEGMENLYQYSKAINGEFARSMDMLATSALYAKNSLGAMVAPIINQLAPAVDALTDRFVDLLNTINETIASLTGASTWTRAIKYPVEYAEATDDATKAAKKFKATILGFDELNVLNDNSDNSRGKASDALDYSKMFTEEEVNTKTSDWVKKLKKSWENADFTDIGRSLGLKLQSGLRSIPWDDMKTEGDRFAKSLGTLINGFVTTDDLGKDIGESIAKAINLGVGTIHTFLTTVEWRKVGTFIGDGISGLINGVDGFMLGQTISGALKGAFNLAVGLLTSVDFYGFGVKVGEFLKGIDWEGVFSGLEKVIWTAFKACIDAIAGLIDENPLAGAILVAVLGLKARSAIAGFAGALGFGGVGGLAATGAANAEAAAGGILNTPITFNAAQVALMAGTAYVGWKLGNWMYENNIFGLGDLADSIVEAGGTAADAIKDVKEKGTETLNESVPKLVDKLTDLIPGIRDLKKQTKKSKENETVGKGITRDPNRIGKGKLLTSSIGNLAEGVGNALFFATLDSKKNVDDIDTKIQQIKNTEIKLGVRTSGLNDVMALSTTIDGLDNKTVTATAKTVGASDVVSLGKNIVDLTSKTVTETAKTVGSSDVISLATGIKDIISKTVTEKATVSGGSDVKTLADNIKGIGSKTVNLVMNVTKAADFDKNLKSVTDSLGEAVIAIMPSTNKLTMGIGSGLKGFAGGGTPDRGSLFIANEQGPELVANIGNRTQVANNAQIIEGISEGVEMANEEQNALLREQNNLLRQLLGKEFTAAISTDSLISGISRKNRRDGQATIAVG